MKTLAKTDFEQLKLFKRGKVRDVYDLGDKLLIISTDRISCFDVILPDAIPYKGKVLTGLSLFWFDFIKDIVPNHLITADIEKYPLETKKYKDELAGRSMLVLKADSLPVECIVRGYLSGSGWKEYKEKQSVCEIRLPKGFLESDKLPEVIFTPSTKADSGHDLNVDQAYIEKLIGKDTADKIRELSIKIYNKASEYALTKGIIIADTKFEFGMHKGKIILIDEVLTPDSSRFWPKGNYMPGKPQPSFDKQFVRDYLETLDWDKDASGAEIARRNNREDQFKISESYRFLTGKNLSNK